MSASGTFATPIAELGPHNPAESTPILFLHRFRGTLDDWDPGFVDELAKTRHVILLSDQGIGTSTGTAATSVDEKARNAAEFARALGYSTIDVLGFSMGGFVCQAIAINDPKLVRKVVVIGSAAGGNPEAAPPTDIVFDIALHPQYTFDDLRYLFFAEGRDEETRAYIERRASRTVDQEPPVTPDTISKWWRSSPTSWVGNQSLRKTKKSAPACADCCRRQRSVLPVQEHVDPVSRTAQRSAPGLSQCRPRAASTTSRRRG
jgi:pimeloyl-ACP methyl ester carboxylesterase